MRMKNILFMLRTKLNTTSKLVFVSFPVNKRLRKANNEDHCLVHHLRFGMRNRLKKGSQIESLEISYLTAFWWTAE